MALQQQAQNEPAQSDKPEDNVVDSEPSNEPPMDKTEAPMIFSRDLPTDPQLSDQDQQSSQPSRQAFVKEIEDEEAGGFARWVEDYPGNAGKTYSKGQSYFECWREAQKENGYEPWAPFEDLEEWELSQWIMQSGLTQNATDKYLKLPIVSVFIIQI